jgi:plastocyanin
MSRTTVPLGTVLFKVVNGGKVAHTFAIAGKRTHLLAPGKSASLTIVFGKAGSYLYSSSVHIHGLYGVLNVVGTATRPSTSTTAATTPQAPSGPQPAAAVPQFPCASPSGSTIKVQIFDFGFMLSQTTVPCGTVTFQITNTGAIQHTFDVQSTQPNGVAAFNGGKILSGGESETQTITFTKSGAFQYQCDQHWIQGQMVGTLSVTQ